MCIRDRDVSVVGVDDSLGDIVPDCRLTTVRFDNKRVACRGKQYIELSQNGDKSLAFVSEQLSK